MAHAGSLGHLLTPANGNSVSSVVQTGLPWAIDNGCFSGFDSAAFYRLLNRACGKPGCLWVVCPYFVAKAKETLDLFWEHCEEIRRRGFAVAFVGQDGQEDLEVPWAEIDCFFVGGSTRWKLSAAADSLCQEAKRQGKAIHVGRVNSSRRMESAFLMHADSIDGSSASMFGNKYIHKYLRRIQQIKEQQQLIFDLPNR
jgi:hypothetical protein